MSELKLYEISEEYISYISTVEKNVFSSKENDRNHTRKYLGIVYSINGYNYYIPFPRLKILITEWKMEYRKSAEALSPSSASLPNPHPRNWNR